MQIDLAEPAARPLLARYTGGEAIRRYHQDAAIRAVLEKIALYEKTGEPRRALLTLATGAGKTFIAVHLLKRIADAGQLRRALFVWDRDELRSQGLGALQNFSGADAAEVYQDAHGRNNAQNARVHGATYQTLDVDALGCCIVEGESCIPVLLTGELSLSARRCLSTADTAHFQGSPPALCASL